MDLIQMIQQISLFTMLPEETQRHLANLLRFRTVEEGDVLFHRGDEGTELYIIVQGRIQVSLSRRLDTVRLAVLGPGDVLGEMALLDGFPRSADAVVLERTQLAVLSHEDFLAFLVADEKAVFGILALLSTRLRKANDLLAEMSGLKLSARLALKLVELAEGQASDRKKPQECALLLTQQELGNMLGVSRESINKELKILRDKGILSTSRNRIHIHNIALLKTSCA
jgi:CRP/FNR family transcriptional regulator, cyclic AMP receptor protein